MAVVKELRSTSLAIEVENGQDKTGATIYTKKNFNGIKSDANTEDILAVANAIGSVLNAGTRDVFLNDSSNLNTVV